MSHTENLLVGLGAVFFLGIGAQWLAWRLKVPSILLLLAFGFLAGPVTGLLDPDALLGDLLFPIVSLSVGIILFEGGLTLRVSEVRASGSAIWSLVTVGALVTWVGATGAAFYLLDFPLSVALLVGAILTVTGPTVVGPMLRHIKPTGRVGSIAKWEGIVIDPIGALLAVLVFESIGAISSEHFSEAAVEAGFGILKTVAVGGSVGLVVSFFAIFLIKRYWVPDHLEVPVLLMFVIVSFAVCQILQEESGLLAVTLMGIVLANQRSVTVSHILEFKENLRTLLISVLFILLAARIEIRPAEFFSLRNLFFVAFLILAVRPAAVFVSTLGSGLGWREKVFLSWMAPRGIVAAAVASVFALHLTEGGDDLLRTVFLVILSTVLVYGLTAPWLARRMGLSNPNPQGVLIGGAHRFARVLAKVLMGAGIQVLLVDTARRNIKRARMDGIPTHYGSLFSEYVVDELDLGGLGRLLALTPSEEVNALANLHFGEVFGRNEVYLLPSEGAAPKKEMSGELRGRILFGREATYIELSRKLATGGAIKKTKLTEEFGYQALLDRYAGDVQPLFLVASSGKLTVVTLEVSPAPKAGDTVIFLTQTEPESEVEKGESK